MNNYDLNRFFHKNGIEFTMKDGAMIFQKEHKFHDNLYYNLRTNSVMYYPEFNSTTMFYEFITDRENEMKKPTVKSGVEQMNEAMNQYDEKGSASHYSDQRINVIHMMERIWGTENTMVFCEMNAFKYRMRIGKKDATEQELIKIKWYETMAKFLKDKDRQLFGLESSLVHDLPEEFKEMLYNE